MAVRWGNLPILGESTHPQPPSARGGYAPIKACVLQVLGPPLIEGDLGGVCFLKVIMSIQFKGFEHSKALPRADILRPSGAFCASGERVPVFIDDIFSKI